MFSRKPLIALLVGLTATLGACGDSDEISGIPDPPATTPSASEGGTLWITSADANALYRVNASTGDAAQTQVGSFPADVVVGHGAVWVANAGNGTVSRVNQETGVVEETIETGDARGLAISENRVWVSRWDKSSLLAINPETNKLEEQVLLANHQQPDGIVYDDGVIYAEESYAGGVIRVDLKTGKTRVIKTGLLTDLVLCDESLYAAAFESVLELDPASLKVTDEYASDERPWAIAPASAGDALWVAFQIPRVTKLDLANGTYSSTSTETGEVQSYDIVEAFGDVWAVDEGGGVFRIDPETTTVSDTYYLPSAGGTAQIAAGE